MTKISGYIEKEKIIDLFKRYQPYLATKVIQFGQELEDLPTVNLHGLWIPVSERLPEEHLCDDGYVEPSDCVLVWGDHGNYGVSRYWGNRRSKSESSNTLKDWMDLDWIMQKPIAWMPLPKPYSEEQEHE